MIVSVFLLVTACSLAFSPSFAEEPSASVPPDLTAGGKKDESHDWLLGPTGLRGWIFLRSEDLTATSRQILVTAVDQGSPADGIVKVNDVILGVFGRPFEEDARRSFGHAIALAEEKTGMLPLTIWRDGKPLNVEIKLQVLGAYSATAPYDCPKSKAIFEQGCRVIAERGLENTDIPDHFNALALLASGDATHDDMLADYVKKSAESVRPKDTWNWYITYVNLFLSEYALAKGNGAAFPEMQHTTMRAVKNQCRNSMWGHAPPLADGLSEGYGGMNVIGVPMTISLELARKAGVNDPALDEAIDKSARFLRYYVDKGAIPYGDHSPWGNSHDDNGKSSCAAVLFDILGDSDAAAFNSWMATAAYDHREQGHCGNLWNMLWALPGVSRSGPLATGAYLKEQAWYYDLARDWKGGFVYQQIHFDEWGDYADWDLTGAYLLSFGLYKKSLCILGKNPSVAPELNAEAVDNVILAGRDRFPEGERNGYYKRKDEELIEGLKSWSPAMRFHSSQAIGKRGGDFVPTLITMLKGKDRYARYGAVEAIGRLGKDAVSASPFLIAALDDSDSWLQCLAADAIARIGDKQGLGGLFAMSLRQSREDSRRMQQRTTSLALFSPLAGDHQPRGILADSLDGVDRTQLFQVIRSLLQNEDSSVRSSVVPVLNKLSDQELAMILPDIVVAIETMAPTNEMFGDDIRVAGLELLSRRKIREGMELCVSTIESRWGNDYQKRLELLMRYGTNAKDVVPQLQEKRALNDPERIAKIDKAIAEIEASTDTPKLISLKDFIANASKGNPVK